MRDSSSGSTSGTALHGTTRTGTRPRFASFPYGYFGTPTRYVLNNLAGDMTHTLPSRGYGVWGLPPTRTRTLTHARTHARARARAHTRTHTRTHARARARTHTHTHTRNFLHAARRMHTPEDHTPRHAAPAEQAQRERTECERSAERSIPRRRAIDQARFIVRC